MIVVAVKAGKTNETNAGCLRLSCAAAVFFSVFLQTSKEGMNFVTQEIPGKGVGVIAVKDIKPGEMIIAEEPLFVVPWWVRHSMYPR